MSSCARGVALPFVLQVGVSNCCNIGDIVVRICTGVPRTDNGVLLVDEPGTDNGVLLVDGPGIDNGVLLVDEPGINSGVVPLVDRAGINDGKTILLVDGPTIDTVLPVVKIGISVIDSSSMDVINSS